MTLALLISLFATQITVVAEVSENLDLSILSEITEYTMVSTDTYSYQWNTITFDGEGALEVEYLNIQGAGNDHIITVSEGANVHITGDTLYAISFGASGSNSSTLNVEGTLFVNGDVLCGQTMIGSKGYLFCKRLNLSGWGAYDIDGAKNAFVLKDGGKLEAIGDTIWYDDVTGEQYAALNVVLTPDDTMDVEEIINIPSDVLPEGYGLYKKDGFFATVDDGEEEPQSGVIYAATSLKLGFESETYKVYFDTNGGETIEPIMVVYGEEYGNIPSSSVAGLSGGDKMWYLIDENGNLTDINICSSSIVSENREHTLFAVRNVLDPTLDIKLTAPGCISDEYQYFNPENSTRVLTVTVNNRNDDVLLYTYKWYKDGEMIDGENSDVLTLDGNVSDAGIYRVIVNATLKDNTSIVVTQNTASAEIEQMVKIIRADNAVFFDVNGGAEGPDSQYSSGKSINITSDEPVRDGYKFISWNTKVDGSGTSYVPGETLEFEEDNGNGGCEVILYAQWNNITPPQTTERFTVTFETNGANAIEPATVDSGEVLTKPENPEKSGYEFVSWYMDETFTKEYDFSTSVTESFTLYAKWQKKSSLSKSDGGSVTRYTVEFDTNGGSEISNVSVIKIQSSHFRQNHKKKGMSSMDGTPRKLWKHFITLI